MAQIELIIPPREKDLGGLFVRRILPYPSHRSVGPFVFFDHMGPSEIPPGKGMDVRPHPHINLSTVTFLYEGKIQHRDSVGSDITIEPGAINWMTAGRGIVHSERTPPDVRANGQRLNGIQCWIALLEKDEEVRPSFSHHPKETLPEFTIDGAQAKLLLGTAYGRQSPVPVLSDMFYVDVQIKKGQHLPLPTEGREAAVYVSQGRVSVDGHKIEQFSMGVGKIGEDLLIEALEDSRLMLLGGTPLGQRFLFWNFVSSSIDRLEEAKREWKNGPATLNPRFQPIAGDDLEYIPLPSEN